jgi:acylphosphatase
MEKNTDEMIRNEPARLHVWVKGRVQGVGFRAFTARTAQMLGLRGWVRNVGNDRVEILAEGTREDLLRLLEAVRVGPRAAVVDEIQENWETPEGKFSGFNVRFW